MAPLRLHTLEEWIRALAVGTPTPAGGALALVSLAGAAALAAKVARLSGRDPTELEGLAGAFLKGAERDGAAYSAAVRGGADEVRACLSLTAGHVESALRLLELLAPLFDGLPASLAADVAAAERVSRAAARTCLMNLAVNLSEWAGRADGLEPFQADLARCKRRLEAE